MTPADVVDMKIRVLLVDDEPLLMRAITRILGQRFDLHCVPNGADGLKSMRESAYAVVVSDMRMPGMDGAEFLKQARVVSPETAQILLTGTFSFDEKIADQRAEIFACLEKPCPNEALARCIEEAAASVRSATTAAAKSA